MKQLFSRYPDRALVLVLLLVAVGLMSPYLLQPTAIMWPRSELGTDLLTYRWPSVYYLQEAVRETGRIPLWQTSVMGGLPLIGNPALRIYYPPQLVLSLLPLPIPFLFALLNTLHFWLAGLGGYGLARGMLRVNRLAALVSAIALMLTPRLSSNVTGDLSHAQGLMLVPLCLFLVWITLDRRSWRWSIAAGISLSFLYLLNLQFALYSAWFIAVYVVCWLVWSLRDGVFNWRWLVGEAGLLALMGAVALGLSAFQLFPFITYLPYQVRDAMTLENANHLALPLPFLINAIAPTAQKFPEWELYVGLLPWMLLSLAFLHQRKRETYFWTGVLVFAVLFSLGSITPLYTLIFQFAPGFRFLRVAPRMWYFAAIAAALLSGLAVDYLMQGSRLSRGWWRWLTLSGGVLMIATVAIRFMTRRPMEPDWLLGFPAVIGVILALIALWRWNQGQLSPVKLGGLLLFVLALDLVPLDFAFHVPRPFDAVFVTPDYVESLPRDTLYRLYHIRRELPDNLVVLNDLEVVEGLNSFQFASYSRLMRLASGCELEGIAAAVPPCAANEIDPEAYLTATPDPTLLGLLNVRYVVSSFDLPPQPELSLVEQDGDDRLYENSAVLPRAFAVGKLSVLDSEADVLNALRTLDPREQVLIDRDQTLEFTPPDHDFYREAEIVAYEPDRIHVRVEMPAAGMLVLSQPWVTGWQADVNGAAQPVLRVDEALQGVYLDAGVQDVVMVFRPTAFVTGSILTVLTAVGCLLAGVVMWWRARLTSRPSLSERSRTESPL
ncbi:MAG: YfhO family protein [Anaerolineae bacterium]|nr:YfhO family protein [Anaerolineae bacterium]